MTQLLLASKSPRRRQLLAQLGFPVTIVDVDVEETVDSSLPLEMVAARLALLKSKGYVSPLSDGQVLVTADTVVVHGGRLMGKPSDAADAVAMLHELSGQRHTVYTGVCLRTAVRQVLFTESTDVYFRRLSDAVISSYVAQGSCMDKAGAYGIQEWIGMVGVEKVVGCYYNVMGLPLSRLYHELGQLSTKS